MWAGPSSPSGFAGSEGWLQAGLRPGSRARAAALGLEQRCQAQRVPVSSAIRVIPQDNNHDTSQELPFHTHSVTVWPEQCPQHCSFSAKTTVQLYNTCNEGTDLVQSSAPQPLVKKYTNSKKKKKKASDTTFECPKTRMSLSSATIAK